jgi:hypothetical protein
MDMDHLPSWTSQKLLKSLSTLDTISAEPKHGSEFRSVKIGDISAALACPLCQGYIIDAISLDGCGHAFCRGCILRHAQDSHQCPVCDITIHHTDPTKAMKHDQLLCDLIYLMVPQLMQNEEKLRDSWVDPNGNLEMVKLATTSSIVLLPHEDSLLKYEGILKLNKEVNLGHLKTALAAEINRRRPENDSLDPVNLRLFSGELELSNILTIGDIFDYNLSWDFEEREGGLQYPVFNYILTDELNAEQSDVEF